MSRTSDPEKKARNPFYAGSVDLGGGQIRHLYYLSQVDRNRALGEFDLAQINTALGLSSLQQDVRNRLLARMRRLERDLHRQQGPEEATNNQSPEIIQ